MAKSYFCEKLAFPLNLRQERAQLEPPSEKLNLWTLKGPKKRRLEDLNLLKKEKSLIKNRR